MGSDAGHKNEVESGAIALARPYVADSLAQPHRFGELHHAIAAEIAVHHRVSPELGSIVVGEVPGRLSSEAITLCDLTGTGMQDTTIATLAHRRVVDAHAGRAFDTEEDPGIFD